MSYEVHCSSCQGRLVIPDELWSKRFVGRVQSLKCKKCGDRIRVDARPEPPLLEAPRLGAPRLDRPPGNKPGLANQDRAKPALGKQALGTQALGKQALGTQALGKQALGTQALGELGKPALGKPALDTPALGKPALVEPLADAPVLNGPASDASGSDGAAAEAPVLDGAADGVPESEQRSEVSRAERTEVSVVFRLPDLPPPDPDALESGQLIPAEPQAVVESAELFDDDDELYNRDTLVRSSWAARAQLTTSLAGVADVARGAARPDTSLDSQPGAALDGSPLAAPRRRSPLRQVLGVAAGLLVVASLIVWLRPRASTESANDSAAAAPEPAAGAQANPRSERGAERAESEPVEPAKVAAVPDLAEAHPAEADRAEAHPAEADRAEADRAEAAAGQALGAPSPSNEPEETLLLGTVEDPFEQQVDRLVEHVMECHITGRAIGTATMTITIMPSGRVTHVSVVGDPIERAPVARCVKVRGLATRFAPFEGGEPLVVSRELIFADFPRRAAPSK